MWQPTQDYKAIIGGILYKNVANPIVVNGSSLIAFSREDTSNTLGVSLEIYDDKKNLIASVRNNEIHNLREGFLVLSGMNRVSVIHAESGQVFLDLICNIQGHEHELELSFLCVVEEYPIVLHPERTKCGVFNDHKAPNISRLTLSTDPGSMAGGIAINNSQTYLLGMRIENLLNGIVINVGQENESA